MTNPFFLTRQTANLLEDFTRSLKAGGSLFLLYGDKGVGKTRLLRELCRTRIPENKIHWLDLAARDQDSESIQDASATIEEIFESANDGDIVVADHFESALKKARHQLLLSWSTDGFDKKLNLVIAGDNEGFNELRQLARQYKVEVQSFQQMPFNSDETGAFLGFHLFPEQPMGRLAIPPALRRQLADCGGIVGKIIEIIERDGAQITLAPMAGGTSDRSQSRTIVSVMIVSALALGLGWYYLKYLNHPSITPLLVTETEAAEVAKVMPDTRVVPEAEPGTLANDGFVNEAQLNAAASPAGAGVALAQPEELPTAVVESETEIVPGTEVVPANKDVDVTAQKAIVVTSEPGTATDTDAVIASPGIDAGGNSYTPDVPAPAVDESPALSESLQPQSTSARFALDLQSSRDWINRNSDAVGTLQISLLTYENFDADTYYEYVESLAKGQVDISKLRVLKTLTGEQQVYSVFFGDYASRDAARKAVGELPEVLRKISPVPRSVGGIMAEIQRLETQN